jgi:hypothetical protein
VSADQGQAPGPDPSTAGPDSSGPDNAGSPTLPNEAGAASELAAVQDAALDDGSQESLLRMLGWRPRDPLPDDLMDGADGDAEDPGYRADGSDPSGVSTANPPEPGILLGGADIPTDPDFLPPEPVMPVNWNTLDANRAEQEWWQLDAFVYWLRDDFGLTPQELPPMWHRHTELVWELSALRTAWLAAHAEDAHAGSPLMWLRDLGDSRRRLRDWVQRCGTTLSEDRPTRRTAWPGEQASTSPAPVAVTDRAADFAVFVADDVARRRQIEVEAQAEIERVRDERLERLREAWHLPGTPATTPAQDSHRYDPGTTDEEGN